MRKLLYVFLLVSLIGCGQASSDKIKSDIKNSKTSKHINIPGTRLYLIPPPNFKIATTFIGLQKGENALLNIYDLVGGDFNTNAATFNTAEFERQGARVFEYKEIQVNGYLAKFIHMQGDPSSKGYAIVFGDTTFSTMIMATYPVTDENTGKEIVKSFNTIWYDKSKKINPFETALFSLNDKESKFKFFQYSSNLYIYTIGGLDNKENRDEPFVIVSQLPKDNTMTSKSIADMMIAKAQQYGLTNPDVRNISTEKINGYDTYQAEVFGQMQGKSSVIYQCVTTKGDIAIVIQGIAKSDLETNVQDFKKIANTIQVK